MLWFGLMHNVSRQSMTYPSPASFSYDAVEVDVPRAAASMLFITVWRLLWMPLILQVWLKVLHILRARRGLLQEVLINLACSLLVGLLYGMALLAQQILSFSVCLGVLGMESYSEAWLANSAVLLVLLLCLRHCQHAKLYQCPL